MTQTKSLLILEPEEQDILIELLKVELAALRQEIAHTETISFKDSLKRREKILQRLLEKVS